MNVLSVILAILTTIPVITFLVIFLILKYTTKRSTYSTKLAADISVIFFLISINGLTQMVFNRLVIWEIVIGLMLLLCIVLFFQWRNEDIRLWRALRLVWRFAFIISFVAYIVLLLIALVQAFV